MRCGKMRCGNIRRCGGSKSFYSQLMALGQKTKSGEAVLGKLNENPELSVTRLQNEGHLFCENGSGGTVIKYAPSGPTTPEGCGMCKNSTPQSGEDVCYDFEGNGDSYSFIIVSTDTGGGINYTRGAPSSSDLPPFTWIMSPCQSHELLEYNELIRLNDPNDILDELRSADDAYANKYGNEGHLVERDDNRWYLSGDGEDVECVQSNAFYYVPGGTRISDDRRFKDSTGCK